MISSIAWVPAGVADPHPKKYEMSPVEEELVRQMQEQGLTTAVEQPAVAAPSSGKSNTTATTILPPVDPSTLPADLRMDEYSDDEDDGGHKKGAALGRLLIGEDPVERMEEEDEDEDDDDEREGEEDDEGNDDEDSEHSHEEDMKGPQSRRRNAPPADEDDDSEESDDDLHDVPDTREYAPIDVAGLEAMGLSHIGLNSDHPDLEDDQSEAEDVQLSPHDAVALVAKTEEEYPSLEVHVYDQQSGNLYVHHDIPLPAFPLCVAHGQVCGERTGNFCAVGTFEPGIEIWNLDVLNALEPLCVLGGQDTSITDDLMRMQLTGEKKAKMTDMQNSSGLKDGSHTDAVMALSWNTIHKQVLASGSADGTVKLWDVTKGRSTNANASTFRHHKSKVQSVAWNPREGTLLATGSFDRTVALVDARGDGTNTKSFRIAADCEAISWDPFATEKLTVVTEDGTMACWDVRNLKRPVWSTVVSEFGGITDLSYNPSVPGLMVTCSTDKHITLWDVNGQQPVSCGSKDMCGGKLYSVCFYPSTPWLVGCGGAGNMLSLWDLSCEAPVQSRFSDRVAPEDALTADEQLPKSDDLEKMIEIKDLAGSVSKDQKKSKGKKKHGGKKKKTTRG